MLTLLYGMWILYVQYNRDCCFVYFLEVHKFEECLHVLGLTIYSPEMGGRYAMQWSSHWYKDKQNRGAGIHRLKSLYSICPPHYRLGFRILITNHVCPKRPSKDISMEDTLEVDTLYPSALGQIRALLARQRLFLPYHTGLYSVHFFSSIYIGFSDGHPAESLNLLRLRQATRAGPLLFFRKQLIQGYLSLFFYSTVLTLFSSENKLEEVKTCTCNPCLTSQF